MTFSQHDLDTLAVRGKTPQRAEQELNMLASGFPYLKVARAATVGDGIKRLDDTQRREALTIWDHYLQTGASVLKLVPASGAASRMFKDLFKFADGQSNTPDTPFIEKFCTEIERFAFFPTLNAEVMRQFGKSIADMFAEGRHREVVATLVRTPGMDYGALPKGLLQFHKTMGGTRLPIQEHMAEGAQIARTPDGTVRLHFTVSHDHRPLFEEKVAEVAGYMGHQYDSRFDVTFSEQKPSTDTIAMTADGEAYRDGNDLFFRPGGHGALIENLNDVDADVIFIKNIDNVVPDALRDSTIEYTKVMGGLLVSLKSKIRMYMSMLQDGAYTAADLDEMLAFLRHELCITDDKCSAATDADKAAYIASKLNRPLRVCGMVKNEGEPGGGPFLVYSADGTIAPQILESVQINPDDKIATEALAGATHFNPVYLACDIKDADGLKFDLLKYVDPQAGFISSKSHKGVEIKALELPGLWNGAMSDWNTVFVEVPSSTFNPVKTVNDLLRPAHQPYID